MLRSQLAENASAVHNAIMQVSEAYGRQLGALINENEQLRTEIAAAQGRLAQAKQEVEAPRRRAFERLAGARRMTRYRDPWQKNPIFERTIGDWIFDHIGYIGFAIVALIIAGAVWYECEHPCVKIDPEEKTYWTTVSCGKNCLYTYPTTYHECLERKP